MFLKGRWVEADSARLQQVLQHWGEVERLARDDGVPFYEAMRLLARGSTGDGDAIELDESARAWTRVEPGPWMAEVLAGLRSPDTLAPVEVGDGLRADLRPYQRVGVQWLWWAHELGLGVCLADDMGLGKTLQVLALLLLRRRAKVRAPAIAVVPASLLGNWKAEADRFCPELRVCLVHSGSTGTREVPLSEQASGADLVLTTYGSLERVSWLVEREWGLIVVDEAQAIKNPNARQTRTVKQLRGRTRLALTGTPVENRLGDLWSLFDFLAPGPLGQRQGLRERRPSAWRRTRAMVTGRFAAWSVRTCCGG